jgi:CDGSH-type Zn-finger protein
MSQDKQAQKPQVIPLPNGPYYYFTEFDLKPVKGITNSEGEELSNIPGVALCRCGGSESKPFCDGTHGKIHFNERRETDGHMDKRESFVGKEITIHKNRGICAHIGFCSSGLPSVFAPGKGRGIDPDAAPVDEIIDVINQCPSGSLSYSIDSVEYGDQDRDSMITVSSDGPYFLVGGIQVVGHEPHADQVSNEHCTLCRCGSSKNKPFCDGTHKEIGFRDDKNEYHQ